MKLSSIIYLFIFILSVDVIYGQKSVAKLSQQETGKDGYADTQVNNITLPTQQKIEEWLHEYKVPAVGIGIIENNKLVHVKVVGKLETNRSAPDNTVFNVASLTKPVVTMLTLKLVEAGKLDLDEPLSNYWIDPDIKHDPMHKLLTARIILSHQTGFANWRGDKKLSFQFKPGSKYQYSGEGFEYLRKAIEQKLGKSLEVLSQMYIFNPLQMKDTRYVWDTSVEPRFATWHDKQGKTYKTWKRTEANAADDLLTTIEDYG
jgi:CubicO group peptidase (beta-lactamase class C family)